VRRKPHVYRASGFWWVNLGGCFSVWITPGADNLRRAMFGEAL